MDEHEICPIHECRLVEPQPTMEKRRDGSWIRRPAEDPFCHLCVESARAATRENLKLKLKRWAREERAIDEIIATRENLKLKLKRWAREERAIDEIIATWDSVRMRSATLCAERSSNDER